MNCECPDDFLPVLSTIPGPRGAAGAPGAAAAVAPAGKNAFAVTTAPFTMPVATGTVSVFVDHTGWCAVGQSLFVESAGYFLVDAIPSAVSLTLRAQTVASNATPGTVIATGKRVVAGGLPQIDGTALSNLNDRVYVLEGAPGGNRTYYATTAPSGASLRTGDIWYDTSVGQNRKMYRWDGSGWVDVTDARVAGLVSNVATLQTGVNTLTSISESLKQEYVLAVVGSGTARRIAGFRVTVPGGGSLPTEFVVQADKFAILGPDGTGKDSPFYVENGAVWIKDAHLRYVDARKITAGDIQSVNIGYAGRIFHTSDTNNPKHYFASTEMAFSSGNAHAFGSSGTGFGFTQATPATAYGPLAPGWDGETKPTFCPNASGKVRLRIDAALIGYEGNILVYGQKNLTTPFALGARNSENGGNATISICRELTGFAPTDVLKIFVAPADGNGVVTAGVTCRYELDVTIFNW